MDRFRSYRIHKRYNQTYWNNYENQLFDVVEKIETVPFQQVLIDEYNKEVHNGTVKINHAILEINNSCNINCLMCNTRLATRKISLMSDEMLEDAVVKLKSLGCSSYSLHTIGDPLANPKLENVFKILSKHNAKASITTNGLLMNRYKDMLKDYMDVCSAVRFSIDGVTKETYEKIRAGGKWETLLESLETVRTELKPIGYYLTIAMVVSDDNYHEIGDYIVKFRDYIDYPHLDFSFGLINSLSPDNTYFDSVKLFDRFIHKKNPCNFVKASTPYVHVDGKVSVCCRDYDGSLQIGDITKNSVSDIVRNSEQLKELQDSHRHNSLDNYNLCNTCYIVDSRLNGLFAMFLQYMLYTSPNESSQFYQERLNKFREIFTSHDPFKAAIF